MRNEWLACVLILLFSAGVMVQGDAGRAQAGDKFLGTWTGTWTASDGGGGDLEMVIQQDKDGKPGATIKVTGGDGDHTAVFTSLKFEGNVMTGKYDHKVGDPGEVVTQLTIDGTSGSGTWVLHPKGQDSEVIARGTWTASKK
jgi:hypothetical protein